MSNRLFSSDQEQRDFLTLVDPEQGVPDIASKEALTRLLDAADEHGLSAIVLRKLSEMMNGSESFLTAVAGMTRCVMPQYCPWA